MSSINLVTTIMNKENLKEKLFEVFSKVDADFTGENGDDYLWNEAKEKGFMSNLEYSLEEAKIKYSGDTENIIREVIKNAQTTWDGYYSDWAEQIISNGEDVIVSISTCCD